MMSQIAEWLTDKEVKAGPGNSIEVSDGNGFLRYVPRSQDNEHYRDIVAADLVPNLAPGPEPARTLSFLQFMDLFTPDEQIAIAGAAMTDVSTKLWYDRAVGARFIDLSDERLTAGLQALFDDGLIDIARRDRVLEGLPPS